MPEGEAEQQAVMEAWGAWFGTLGDAVVDMGTPFGASSSVSSDGSNGAAGSGLTGYSIVTAESLDDATAKAGGCPIVHAGGSVDIYETVDM
jgi:hypothetical protein